jgi:hypothetical protein
MHIFSLPFEFCFCWSFRFSAAVCSLLRSPKCKRPLFSYLIVSASVILNLIYRNVTWGCGLRRTDSRIQWLTLAKSLENHWFYNRVDFSKTWLTLCGWVVLERPQLCSHSRTFQHFMQREGLLPLSQESSTCEIGNEPSGSVTKYKVFKEDPITWRILISSVCMTLCFFCSQVRLRTCSWERSSHVS